MRMFDLKGFIHQYIIRRPRSLFATDLEKFLSGKTVNVSPYINTHDEGIEGTSSVKDFETFLQLTNLYFTQPRKDQALFNSFVSRSKSQIKNAMANPRNFYTDTLTKILYNGNPWASGFPTVEEFDQLNADKAMELYKQTFGNAHGMHFTFVGNIDPNTAKPLLEKYLGSLPSSPMQPAFKDNGLRPVKGILNANIKRGKEPQSLITITWTGETEYSREETMALRGLIEVLNIKTIEKLREELGGMYSGGFNGGITKRPYINYSVSARVPCGPENVEKLTNALLELVKNAQEGKIDQKDLDKVKESWRKQYQVNMKENDNWLNVLSQAFIDQTNPENILDYEAKVNALTVEDLQKAAKKFLNMNNYVRAVLYPENANVPAGIQKTF